MPKFKFVAALVLTGVLFPSWGLADELDEVLDDLERYRSRARTAEETQSDSFVEEQKRIPSSKLESARFALRNPDGGSVQQKSKSDSPTPKN